MCPTWTRIADEIELLASDRALAASVEPEAAERCLLEREAALLRAAEAFARSGPGDGFLVHTACEGVVVHCEHLVLWGISDAGERALRALAADPRWAHAAVDRCLVLAAVLGVPQDPLAQARSAA